MTTQPIDSPWSWRLTPDRLLWLTTSLVLVVLPHAQRVPVWASTAFVLFAAWRVGHWLGRAPLPGALSRLAIQALLLASVYLEYETLFGRNPGVALLVSLTGLKLLETRTRRDAFVCVLLGYFLVVTNFLYSQTIPTGLYMVAVVMVTTTTLVRINASAGELSTRQATLLAGSLLLQSLPLMLALFLLFPRIPGPLWGLPEDALNAVTGIGETMSPGTITRLSQSNAVAFRVLFAGEIPDSANRYWRGPVLWDTDGRLWRTGSFEGEQPGRIVATGGETRYSVTLEAHPHAWLYLLEMPVALPEGARMAHDFTVSLKGPIRERIRYEAASSRSYRLPEISRRQRLRALALPAGEHPRARLLAQAWREEIGSPATIVQRGLAYFAKEGFTYTLTPPALFDDPVDEVLFEAKRGFCEHYAAAFTVLMRAAGIPARVVTGYQGGEVNPLDGYLVVRQRDAHAWAEVWLDESGWVRIDPTAAVSPERVEQGLETALPERATSLLGLRTESGARLYRLIQRLRFGWDAANNWWNQWVLGYGEERQRDLLAKLGIDSRDWRQVGVGLILLGGLSLTAVVLWLIYREGTKIDHARRLYDRFCTTLARRGMTRSPGEGPRDFADRIRAEEARIGAATDAITKAYIRLRYGQGGDLAELRRLVRRFRAQEWRR